MSEIVDLNLRATCTSVEVVKLAAASDLDRPTPCGSWNLAELLAHMVAQHRGFAAAARGNVDDLEVWDVHPLGSDPVAEYAAAAGEATDAFAAIDLDTQTFWLPEIRHGGPFPAAMAVAFHLVDAVVHAWDVAVSIGATPRYPADVLATALTVAQFVPDGADREGPGAAFEHALPLDANASPLDQILLLLGRAPSWSPGSA